MIRCTIIHDAVVHYTKLYYIIYCDILCGARRQWRELLVQHLPDLPGGRFPAAGGLFELSVFIKFLVSFQMTPWRLAKLAPETPG